MLKILIKDWIIPGVIITGLYFSGLLGQFAACAQGAILKTGLFNVDTEHIEGEDFNYNQSLYDQKGELVNLSQFKGKVVFLNLWASWCAPCKAEMPGIDELYLDLKNEKDIVFVMLSIDRNEQAAKRYMDKQAYAFPYYQWSGSLTSQLTVSSIPTTYVVSKEGKILKKEVGMARYNTNAFKKFLLKEANGE